jgi:histidinol phosphatase-like PHP family hydrolase
MKDPLTRRTFLAGAAGAAGTLIILKSSLARAADAPAATPSSSSAPIPTATTAAVNPADFDFQIVDYHVHLDGMTIDRAAEYSKERGYKYGIVEHAGTKENQYPVVLGNDEDLRKYMAMLEGKGVYKGIQAECIDWMTVFSKEAVAELDFVLSDALTFVEKDGRRVELWKAEKIKIDDKQDFMDRYMEFTARKVEREPIDILAAATTLPKVLEAEYDTLWTEARMKRIIDAAVKNNVAIEIGGQSRLPRMTFLKVAKEAGAKFSFGSNGRKENSGRMAYCFEAARTLGLKKSDMFTPAPAGKKPIQARKMA